MVAPRFPWTLVRGMKRVKNVAGESCVGLDWNMEAELALHVGNVLG
jgi:hypothetical protein